MATQKQVFTEITESIDRCNHTLPGLIQFLKNGFKKLENATGSGGGGSEVSWSQTQATGTKIAEIEIDDVSTNVYVPAVSATQIQSTGTKIASLTIGSDTTDLYAPTTSVSVQASDVAYSNTVSGLTADNCQEAIDELSGYFSSNSNPLANFNATVVRAGKMCVLTLDQPTSAMTKDVAYNAGTLPAGYIPSTQLLLGMTGNTRPYDIEISTLGVVSITCHDTLPQSGIPSLGIPIPYMTA